MCKIVEKFSVSNRDYAFVGDLIFVFRDCSFLGKTIVAEQAGAVAAIIMDSDRNNDQSMIDMIQDETDRSTNIPSFFLLGKDG